MGRTAPMRLWALWTAYGIMVGGFALATYRLDERMADIEGDICDAVIIDLKVDLLDPNLDADSAAMLADLIAQVRYGCDN